MKRLSLLILLAGAAFGQTSTYPTALDTNASLFVTGDFVQSTLSAAVGVGDATITVASGANFAANQIITICDTSVSSGVLEGKCTAWEHMKVTAVNSNVLTVTRAFAGTSARSHSAGKAVSLAPKSVEREVLVDAVKKIETALGANLSSLGHYTARYDFTAQTPGGSLIAGNNSIPMTPVPAGVNGTDSNHYLYVSGGTGTAEACLITGGSGTAGSASGTIIINCANTHSGAWTIQSATAGIQEAVQAAGDRSKIHLACGLVTVRAPIRVNGYGVEIVGCGNDGSLIYFPDTGTANVFEFVSVASNQGNALRDVFILGTSGKTGGYAVYASNQGYFNVLNVYVQDVPNGIYLSETIVGRVNDFVARNLEPSSGIGMLITGNSTNDLIVDHFFTDQASAPLYGVKVEACGYMELRSVSAIRAGTGLAVVPGNGQVVASLKVFGSHFDGAQTRGVLISPATGGYVQRVKFDSSWSSSATQQGVWITTAGGGTVDGVQFSNHEAYLNGTQGFLIAGGTNINIEGARVGGNSAASSGASAGIHIAADVSKWSVTNSRSGPADGSDIADSQGYGLFVASGASDNYHIAGNDFSGNTVGQLSDSGTGVNKVVRNNLGVDTATPPTIASAATIALPTSGVRTVYISGTTQITTINGGAKGETVTLIFTNASPGGIGTGGNIARAQTAAQNQALRVTFDGTSWY